MSKGYKYKNVTKNELREKFVKGEIGLLTTNTNMIAVQNWINANGWNWVGGNSIFDEDLLPHLVERSSNGHFGCILMYKEKSSNAYCKEDRIIWADISDCGCEYVDITKLKELKKEAPSKITEIVDLKYLPVMQKYIEAGQIYDRKNAESIDWHREKSYTSVPKSQKIIYKGRTTKLILDHVIDGKIKKFIGVAKCDNTKDDYDKAVGRRLAYIRALQEALFEEEQAICNGASVKYDGGKK